MSFAASATGQPRSQVTDNVSRPLNILDRRTKVLTFPTNYLAHPKVMVESCGTAPGLHLPQQSMMRYAFQAAQNVLDKELPKAVQDDYYAGVDLDNPPSSAELTEAASKGQIRLQDCYFHDFLSAEYYRGALRPNKADADGTIPLTNASQKAHVQLLVKAFNNAYGCGDNEPIVRPFVEKRHDPKLTEVLCWGILKACIMRSNSDEPLLTAYEPHKARNTPNITTFAQRFDAIIKSMTVCKTLCKHLTDAPFVNTLVDDPVRALRRVEANRALNRQKGEIMGKGKDLLDEELKAKGETPRQRTRKRTAAKAEDVDSPAGVQTPTRRSDILKLPLHSSPTPGVDAQGSDSVTDNSLPSFNLESQSTPTDDVTSPTKRIKLEAESPRHSTTRLGGSSATADFFDTPNTNQTLTANDIPGYESYGYNISPPSHGYVNSPQPFGGNSSRPYFGTSSSQPTFGHRSHQPVLGYGGSQSSVSHGNYQPGLGLTSFPSSFGYSGPQMGTGYGAMAELFAAPTYQLRQGSYGAYQNAYGLPHIANRVAASAPTTPTMPGFGDKHSFHHPVGNTSSTLGFTPSTLGCAVSYDPFPEEEEEEYGEEEAEAETGEAEIETGEAEDETADAKDIDEFLGLNEDST